MESITSKDIENVSVLETQFLNKGDSSLFYKKYEPSTTFSICELPFLSSKDGGYISFQIKGDESQLYGSFVVIKTPTIEILPKYFNKYKVRWCDNIAHNICENIIIEYKNCVIQCFDPKILDMITEFDINNEKHKLYNYMVGNRKSLTEPSNILHEDTVMMPLMAFYSDTENPSNSLTIGNLQSKPEFKHKIKLNSNVIDLLIVYEKQADGTYSTVSDDKKSNYVNIKGANRSFNTPTLIGNFARLLHSEEKSHFKKSKEYFYSESIHLSTESKGQVDGANENMFTIPLDSIDGPVEAIYYALENKTSSRYGIKSNYTVNSEAYGAESYKSEIPNSYTDDDPCEHISIGNEYAKRMNNMPCYVHSIMTPYKDGSRTPQRVGLHKISFKLNAHNKNPNGFVRFQKGEKLNLKLHDLGERKYEEHSRHRYVLHIIVKVVRLLEVSNGLITKRVFAMEENKPKSKSESRAPKSRTPKSQTLKSNIRRKPRQTNLKKSKQKNSIIKVKKSENNTSNRNNTIVKITKSDNTPTRINSYGNNTSKRNNSYGSQKRTRIKVKRSN